MKSDKPLISIALSTYNGEAFLKEQMDSLITQTYRPLEIVVIDDCSTDNTGLILQRYQSCYPEMIRVEYNDMNRGCNKSFQRALELCSGELIAISDQDDIWLPEKIKTLYSLLGDSSLIYSNSMLIDEKGNDLNTNKFKMLYPVKCDPRCFSLKSFVAGHSVLFRRCLLEFTLPFPNYGYYDWWLSIVAANNGKIRSTNLCLTKHRVHDSNLSRKLVFSKEKAYNSMSRWIEEVLKIKELRYRSFFERLYKILNSKSRLRDWKLILFQLRYNRVIFFNKSGFVSRINAARKITLFFIPKSCGNNE